ncbi:DNA polymerase Y family protein [Consotaella salsifontis]|uniref:Y-family DNA polymerase n=1 Tax=Consotaella salsifontis TaxID=1365950 RepID=UPI00099A02E6
MLYAKERGALRIVAVDAHAAALGLAPGLALADARARFPRLFSAEGDPHADARLLERLALFCDRFSPLVAVDGEAGLLLDVTGCAHLFGGEAALLKDVRRRLQGFGLAVEAALAATPEAAHVLSRFRSGAIAAPGEEGGLVRPLPLAALELSGETALALARAGLKTVGQVADRTPSELVARFGAELTRRLGRVLGEEDIRISPLRPAPEVIAERHLAEPLLETEALVSLLARLAGEIALCLERRGEGGRRFEASFYRTDGLVRRIPLETSRPSRDAAMLIRLYRERLDALSDPLEAGFGFDAVRLSVLRAEKLENVQPSLDGHAVEEADMAALVDRLIARFGAERVLRLAFADTHDPRRVAVALPAVSAAREKPVLWPEPEAGEPPLRPLQLFDPPQAIETLAEVPDGPPLRFRWRKVLHTIARAEGPERIAPEWWREDARALPRDYYRIEDLEGRRFWVFREGLAGEMEGLPRWYLHGLFA